MKAWRQICYLTLVFAMFPALRPETNRVESQNLSAPVKEVSNGSAKLGPEDLRPRAKLAAHGSTLLIKDASFAEAYVDVATILSHKNSCHDFFGGSDRSLEAFNRLAAMMTKTFIPQNIGIRMSGDYTIVSNSESGNRYRLFSKAEINDRGPFYHQKIFADEPSVPPIGGFLPNTREARALMLLHELGHMIEVAPRHWLLPNDGNNEALSLENTRTVKEHCLQEIEGLRFAEHVRSRIP